MLELTLDVETQWLASEVDGGWSNIYGFGLACAVVHHSELGFNLVYRDDEREKLQRDLLRADRITGWNIWRFDYRVIWEDPPWDLLEPKTNDLMRRCWQACGLDPDSFGHHHGKWGLNRVAMNTLGYGKGGNGKYAPQMYRAGALDELYEYCAQDVAITRHLAKRVEAGKSLSNGHRHVLLPPLHDS